MKLDDMKLPHCIIAFPLLPFNCPPFGPLCDLYIDRYYPNFNDFCRNDDDPLTLNLRVFVKVLGLDFDRGIDLSVNLRDPDLPEDQFYVFRSIGGAFPNQEFIDACRATEYFEILSDRRWKIKDEYFFDSRGMKDESHYIAKWHEEFGDVIKTRQDYLKHTGSG